jgi:hypothetical protein
MAVHQHNFSLLVAENKKLRIEINDLQDDNDNLNKWKNNQSVITKLEVHIQPSEKEPLDIITQKELEAKVRGSLKIVIGKKISTVQEAHDLYRNLISGKVYFGIQGKDFKMNVQTIMVTGTQFHIWVVPETFVKIGTFYNDFWSPRPE